jgi:hypothetical protein
MKIDLTKLAAAITELIEEAKQSIVEGNSDEQYSTYLGELQIEGIDFQLQLKLQSDEYEFLEPLLDSVI